MVLQVFVGHTVDLDEEAAAEGRDEVKRAVRRLASW